MTLLLLPVLIAAVILVPALNRAFQRAQSSPNVTNRLVAAFGKTFLLWAILGSAPLMLIVLQGPFSLGKLGLGLLPGVVLGAIGTAIMNFVVPAGSKSAPVTGFLLGGALPPIVLWTLAIILPKDEGTMGYVLFGFILAIPNAIAGAVAGKWRATATPAAG
jgi:hypothetical protein